MKTVQTTIIKNIFHSIAFLFCFANLSFAVDNPMSYQNALFDSDAMKYNGEYYFSGNFMAGDMLVSRDLRNWGWRVHAFSWNNSWHSGSSDSDIHGPHLRYENGIFHYYAHLGVGTSEPGKYYSCYKQCFSTRTLYRA